MAVRLAGPGELRKLLSVSSSGLRILALVKLRAHRYATSQWRKAIAVAATTSSLTFAVTPTSAANQTLSPYLNQLGKPPSAPPSFAVTGSTTSTVSLAWTAVVGATEYDLTANGAFAGKTATTSFTLGGLACNTTYKLAVTAKSTAGKTSKASTLTTSTASCSDVVMPPTGPTGLTEVSSSTTSATVAWADSTDNVAVTGYAVSVDGTSIATTSATSYAVGGLTCGSTHTVAVDAFDAAGNHSTRASMTASTSACPDTTPPTVGRDRSQRRARPCPERFPVTATASDKRRGGERRVLGRRDEGSDRRERALQLQLGHDADRRRGRTRSSSRLSTRAITPRARQSASQSRTRLASRVRRAGRTARC